MEVASFEWSVAPLALWLRLIFVDISTEASSVRTYLRCTGAAVCFVSVLVLYVFSFDRFWHERDVFYDLIGYDRTMTDRLHVILVTTNWSFQWLVAHVSLLAMSRHKWPILLQSFQRMNERLKIGQADLQNTRRTIVASLFYIVVVVSIFWLAYLS